MEFSERGQYTNEQKVCYLSANPSDCSKKRSVNLEVLYYG